MPFREILPCDYRAPEGALPGQFCAYHVATDKNPEGTDCSAQLEDYGQIFKCPFTTPDAAINGIRREDGSRGGICADLVLRGFGPDYDFSE